jgi:tetratricopeptide (TPR) repeat protein
MTPALLFVLLAQQAEAAGAGDAGSATSKGDPVSQYLSDLEQAGVLGGSDVAPSLPHLKDILRSAEDDLVTGNPQVATTRLFRVVESPQWKAFSYAPEYEAAEFTLGRALARVGAYDSARRYLLRVLGHGPKHPYFAPAYRTMVDAALETREQVAFLTLLEGIKSEDPLPRDSENERGYLRGKVAYERGDLAAAAASFGEVDRQSRFQASALYFRGLIAARQQRFAMARRNLCEIVEQADKDRFSFFIDGRYYAIKDLAYLALGRIAHEQGKYDDAYYFYFRVPEDSERLPDALFEAAWSMFQKGEYEAAGAFIDQFDRMFPRSPLAPDVLLLHAMIDLKSCQFEKVRTTLDALVKTYVPIEQEVAALIKDPSRRQVLYRRLLSKSEIGHPTDRVVELLKIDSRFYRYYSYLAALDREVGALPAEVAVWDEMTAKETGKAKGSEATEVVQLVEQIRELQPLAKGDPEMEARVGALLNDARRAARPVSTRGGGPFTSEAAQTLALGSEAQRLRARLVTATTAIAEAALIDLDQRLKHMLVQARLTHIDAVIGKKKKLEIEIANLREGRYPPDMFAQLQLEGLMGDDEEYWPFEGEHWSDEYDNYK